ncbi:substrate-binding domain-containing protein [Elioraea sp.]|uniref:substrate-binding domain-containing protein n=1 Tax=Elioraea sp. TaxID=2185103 RepID=UPI003F7310AB
MLDLLTLREAAAALRLSERALYDLVRRREVPCARIGGRWLFPRATLAAWVAVRVEGAPPSDPPPILAGSDDPLLAWALRESCCGLALLAEGSLAGLDALAEGRAVLAALHVPDPDGGGWNVPLIEARLPHAALVAIGWAARTQGLIVPSGNPAGLATVTDLARPGLRVALRHPRSGSHALLTHLLSEAGRRLDALTIGVRDAPDHAAIAQAVAEGRADAGFGIRAAASDPRVMFLPVIEEHFDLVMHRRDHFRADVQALLRFARTPAFAERAARLGGYDVRRLGEVMLNQ